MVTVRRRSRLKISIQIELIKYFCAGSTARSAAELTGVNRNTAILFFHKLRETIHEEIVSDEPPMMSSEIEVYKSYFGGRRKGKRHSRLLLCNSLPCSGTWCERQSSRLRAFEEEWLFACQNHPKRSLSNACTHY